MDDSRDPRAPRPNASTVLRLAGRDALAVLHRIGTQSLADLAPGQARVACFCDFRGRLLHRACVAVDREGAVWLLRADAPGDALAGFVDRHVFREDVRLEDRGAGTRVSVRFDAARSAAAPATLEAATAAWSGATAGGAFEIEARPGVTLVVSPASDVLPGIDEARRIASAEPRHGHEIAETFTPFEIGIGHEVHLSKGCFTGQEALMRLVTYRSVRRGLFRLHGEGAPPAAGTELKPEGGRAGVLTSVAGVGAGWTGLAVLPPSTQAGDLAAGLGVTRCEAIDSGKPLGLPVDVHSGG